MEFSRDFDFAVKGKFTAHHPTTEDEKCERLRGSCERMNVLYR